MLDTIRHTVAAAAICLAMSSPALGQEAGESGFLEVALVDAGADSDRRTLRYTSTQGAVRDVRTRILTDVESSTMGAITLPAMVTNTRLAVTSVAEDEVAVALEFTDARAEARGSEMPGAVEQLGRGLKQLEGAKATMAVSGRGEVTRFKLDRETLGLNAQVLEYMDDAMQRLATPLPEEAVGVGAVWRVDRPITRNGIEMQERCTYTLEELSGDTARISMDLQQSADPQRFSTNGMEFDLVSLSSTGTADITIDLGRIAPTKITHTLSQDYTVRMAAGSPDLSQQLTQSMEIVMVDE